MASGCVVGQHAAITASESVCRRCPDHVGQDVGEQFSGHGLAVALGVF